MYVNLVGRLRLNSVEAAEMFHGLHEFDIIVSFRSWKLRVHFVSEVLLINFVLGRYLTFIPLLNLGINLIDVIVIRVWICRTFLSQVYLSHSVHISRSVQYIFQVVHIFHPVYIFHDYFHLYRGFKHTRNPSTSTKPHTYAMTEYD